ncbi:hypothetical protein CFP56_008971 [Quercus suber]|uniref:Uncharacterized protein n=1 Tax=Quercus suber TaxID=58331 RepID=A0AAW0L2J7_QUESU
MFLHSILTPRSKNCLADSLCGGRFDIENYKIQTSNRLLVTYDNNVNEFCSKNWNGLITGNANENYKIQTSNRLLVTYDNNVNEFCSKNWNGLITGNANFGKK